MFAALVMFGALNCGPASAHPMPGSAVLLDFQERAVQMELHLPVSDLEIGFTHDPVDKDASVQRVGQGPLTSALEAALPLYRARLKAYLARHVRPVALDGRHWSVVVDSVVLPLHKSTLYLVARLTLTPPPGASLRHFKLNYDVITHEVLTHEALVSVRSDWRNGKLGNEPQLIGRIRWVVKSVDVDQPEADEGAGWRAAVRLGMQHIAEGTDHLMFLLVLLLPAPLLAANGQWRGHRSLRGSIRHLASIVTAFTVGHCITLIAGGQGWVTWPQGPIEVAIAASILISAIHAWRPLFPGRESWVAGAFGLVHGLAFASVITELKFDVWHRTLAMLGFNVGIELMQLAVVVSVLPLLLFVSDLKLYRWIRTAGAAFAGMAAVGWMVERIVGLANPLEPLIDMIAGHAPMTLLTTTVCVGVARVSFNRMNRPAVATVSALERPG